MGVPISLIAKVATMNVLFLFASSPASPSAASFWQETATQLSLGHSVSVYLLHEGAAALLDQRLVALRKQNLRLFACPRAIEQYGRGSEIEATLGGPGLLAELIERSHTLRSFDPS